MINRTRLLCAALALLIIVIGLAPSTLDTTAAGATLPPTNTPHTTKTSTALPTLIPAASTTGPAVIILIPGRLCSDCDRVRLRSTPGTAGEVIDFLTSNAEIMISGRTEDNQWLKVQVKATGLSGWIAADFVRLSNGAPATDDVLNRLPVDGVATEASPTPTSEHNIPFWLYGVTSHSREIFLKGQKLGNRANVFSKVGDSVTDSPYFLVPIGQGNYNLGAYGNLSGAIGYFSQANARQGNSFVNKSMASGGGWSAFTVISPADTSATCGSDDLLVCEYKAVKPAVALIMFGTNDSGSGSPAQFSQYMKEIVQTSIDMGVIPVLSTIPPKHIDDDQAKRVTAFNKVIRDTAAQFDVPLWDYYAVMAKAPNQGMSADGLHPSVPPDGATGNFTAENLQYGYTIRNLMAVQVLDVLWRLVLT